MERTMTQTSEVKKYLKTHKRGITSKLAFELFGATRLSAIIYELRNRHGLNIVAEDKEVKTRYGRRTIVANYRLV